MENVDISIIMPLYNSEKYLEESLKSVLEQTFKNYELICVNDGSTDGTLDILEKFFKKDNRVRIISNSKRSGAACSRNKGMSMANGTYLAFLDGDDIFDETMLEKAYGTIEKNVADIVIFDYKHVPSEQIYDKLRIDHGREYRDRFCKNTFTVYDCEPYEFINWPLGPCNKLYRRMFIQDNCLEFQDISCSNDVFFVYMALLLSSRTIVLDVNRIMIYARDHFEASRISCNRDSMCNYMALMKIGQELVKRGKFKELSPYFYYRVFFSLRDGLVADHNEERARAFYHFLQKEGINNLCSLDKCYCDISDQYIRTGMEQFAKNSFESGWYYGKSILGAYLYHNKDKVTNLWEKLRKEGKKIAIWGCGKNGKILLEFCIRHKLEIETVIDKAKGRQGCALQGYIVVTPQQALDRVQVIIISAYSIYSDVSREVENRNIEIIDINQFLCLC